MRNACLTMVLCGALLAGCSSSDEPAPHDGKFTVSYEEPAAERAGVRDALRRAGVLERLAADFDRHLRPPVDVPLVVKDCGEANAFYDPEQRRLELCYELAAEFQRLFAADDNSAQEVETKVSGAVAETYAHEMGHALIHLLKLPITGPEEDAADGFAAYWLINTDGGQDMIIDAADAYRLSDADTATEDLPVYDNHSLDIQRYTRHLCYLYGHDAKAYKYLVDEGNLPADRAESCADEYTTLASGWRTLLQPYTQ